MALIFRMDWNKNVSLWDSFIHHVTAGKATDLKAMQSAA